MLDEELDLYQRITPLVFVAPIVISVVPSAWCAARRPSLYLRVTARCDHHPEGQARRGPNLLAPTRSGSS